MFRKFSNDNLPLKTIEICCFNHWSIKLYSLCTWHFCKFTFPVVFIRMWLINFLLGRKPITEVCPATIHIDRVDWIDLKRPGRPFYVQMDQLLFECTPLYVPLLETTPSIIGRSGLSRTLLHIRTVQPIKSVVCLSRLSSPPSIADNWLEAVCCRPVRHLKLQTFDGTVADPVEQ